MKKSQIISMDLVFGFMIFIIAISFFFFFLKKVPFINQKKTLNVQTSFIYRNIESIPNNRINFLKQNKIDVKKLNIFAKIPYFLEDSDGDRLLDIGDPTPNVKNGDFDLDGFGDYSELLVGTNPFDENSFPIDDDLDKLNDDWEIRMYNTDDASSSYEMIDGIDNLNVISDSSSDFDCDGEISLSLIKDFNNNAELEIKEPTGIFPNGSIAKKCTIYGHTIYDSLIANTYHEQQPPYKHHCKPCIPNLFLYYHDKDHGDFDRDGLNDINELNIYGTNFSLNDTDGDGLLDGLEITMGFDPNDETDPGLGYISGNIIDGRLDKTWVNKTGLDEYENDKKAWDGDPDDDKRINFLELVYGTDPLKKDSDSDGLSDFKEIIRPIPLSIYQLVFGNINTNNYDEMDVCIYFENQEGDVIKHIGPNEDKIIIKEGINCGDLSNQLVDDASANCISSTSTNAIAISKPVFYEDNNNIIILNMKILICAEDY
ncbi:hypothetical protein HN827_06570 [archaeon]|jgi:hypothetical protein|nr:hypothetical protein [archaeon]